MRFGYIYPSAISPKNDNMKLIFIEKSDKEVEVHTNEGMGAKKRWEQMIERDIESYGGVSLEGLMNGFSYYAQEIGEYRGPKKTRIDSLIKHMKRWEKRTSSGLLFV